MTPEAVDAADLAARAKAQKRVDRTVSWMVRAGLLLVAVAIGAWNVWFALAFFGLVLAGSGAMLANKMGSAKKLADSIEGAEAKLARLKAETARFEAEKKAGLR